MGVFLVNIYLPYFIAFVVAGYTYRSRGASLQENVNSVFSKIPERYRDGMRFGNRNEFLRGIIGVAKVFLRKKQFNFNYLGFVFIILLLYILCQIIILTLKTLKWENKGS